MDNKRTEERKNLMAFTPVYGLHPKTLLGYVEDLTTKGAMVIGEKEVEVGTQTVIMIEVPGALPESTSPRLIFPARVAWCKPDDKPNYYNIGFEFLELRADEINTIEAVLRRYEFRRDVPLRNID